jgi:N-methylhydantoinase A
MSTGSLVVGIDVGGTFTDLFVLDEASGRAQVVKVPSTRGEEARGFMNGIERVGAVGDIATIVHGTTVGTNALLERKVARTGIITTRGFRDVLEMRRRDRPQTWGLRGNFVPIVPRELRLEVDERVLADGTVHTPVNLDQVREQAHVLLSRGCDAVCVFFINAYANSANERAACEAIRDLWPNQYVTAASDVLPEIREFERCSTATLNAALQPVVGGYLSRIESELGARGFAGDLLIVQSNGGVMSRDTASTYPVRTALSGPAAGVIACAAIARTAGHGGDVIRRVVGDGWRSSAGGANGHRVWPGRALAHDPDRNHWCGWWLHCIGGRQWHVAGGAGVGRQHSGARMLRAWQHASHRHRRQRRSGAHCR